MKTEKIYKMTMNCKYSMSSTPESVKRRQLRLKIKLPKVRDINSSENKLIRQKLDDLIDQMIKYRPYYSQIASSRSQLSGSNSILKKYIRGALFPEISLDAVIISPSIYRKETKYGEMKIHAMQATRSTRIAFTEKALLSLGLEEDRLEIATKMLEMYVVFVDTTCMGSELSILERRKQLVEDIEGELSVSKGDLSNTDVTILRHILTIKKFIAEGREYIRALGEARKLFMKHSSRDGSFPRDYISKGVVFGWQDLYTDRRSYYHKVIEYLTYTDIINGSSMRDQFGIAMLHINKHENTGITLRYC